MKRAIITAALSLALVFGYACSGNGKISKGESKRIKEYFTQSLQDADCSYSNNKKVKIKNIAKARAAVWECWKEAVDNYSEEKLIAPFSIDEPRDTGYWHLPEALEPDATMPYYFIEKGEQPAAGYPLFLYMHGSGPKTSEWESGFRLCHSYDDAPSLHFIPQIPNGFGELYRWAIQSKQWAWEKLLRLAFLNENIDRNRIYFYGISEGGYGSQRLASFYADYLAGAGPMAGGEPLKNAPMENLANIAFSLRTGEMDYGFGRNAMTDNAAKTIAKLAEEHPGLYKNFIEIVPGMGHGINYETTTPWLSKHTRNPHPTYFYWEDYDMYGRHRTGFYNLRVNETSRTNDEERTCYEVKIDGNTIEMTVKNATYTTTRSLYNIPMFFERAYQPATKGNVTLFLNEELFDLTQPVKVVVNGKEAFNGKVQPTIEAMVESCAEYFDPERVFPAKIDVEIK